MNKNVQYPSEPKKMNIRYPEKLQGACPICFSPVKRKYNTSEKTIFRLDGPITVRYDLMTCTNKKCQLHKVSFNPSPRFDYSQRSYGKDVLAKIGEYSILSTTKLNSQQITEILKREYALPISSRTVARMADDILILTSFQIDINTKDILKNQKNILIALDGQEPDGEGPALWNFTDLISGRVLITRYLERVDYLILHECIEELKKQFQLPIIGFMSDKQSSIRKCMETFYPDIPHQYCTYHFSTNLWNHLEKYANNIHTILNKTVKKLYINIASVNTLIKIPNENRKVSLKNLCSPLAKEIQATLKYSNEKFKQLKGIEGFERLSKYTEGFTNAINQIPYDDRFSKILQKSIKKINESLEKVRSIYGNAVEGIKFFQQIHKLLWKDELKREIKEESINDVFDSIWERTLQLNPEFKKKDRKSFLPSRKTPYWAILGEYTRLWDRYRPGLFQYFQFPTPIKSNVEMEQKFSTETQRFRSQSGRGHIGQMIRSRGEFVLRLQYSSEEDINFEQIIGNSKVHLEYLRKQLQQNITESCKNFKNHQKIELVYLELLERMYEVTITEVEGN